MNIYKYTILNPTIHDLQYRKCDCICIFNGIFLLVKKQEKAIRYLTIRVHHFDFMLRSVWTFTQFW